MGDRYDILQEYVGAGYDRDHALDVDSISTSPSWLMCVIPFKNAVTFSRLKMGSFSTDPNDSVATKPKLIIDDDCTNLQIDSNKPSHTSSLASMLAGGDVNYSVEILPGDWLMAWIVNTPDKAADLKRRILAGDRCNDFDDGLKFVGRVLSCRKKIHQDPGGTRTSNHTLQATGFRELDSKVFFDPYLVESFPTLNDFMGAMNKSTDQFISGGGKGVTIRKALPLFLDLLLGEGISDRVSAPGDGTIRRATGLTKHDGEAPFAYVVPAEVGALLGKTNASKPGGVLSYADLLELLFGVQRYVSTANQQDMFLPDGVRGTDASNRQYTTKADDMLGSFLPTIPQFTDKSVWSILGQYLNPVVNEMFTTLRVNSKGHVVPTMVVRQLPFTTPIGALKNENTTPFMELPRWFAHPILVKDAEFGRSEVTRINFVHVYGQSAASQEAMTITKQIIRNPPIIDDADAQRFGLSPFMATVACSIQDTTDGPKKWMEIIADFLMGQQLTVNGTFLLHGIQAPICPGDNFEAEGFVFHIEAVSHQCGVDPNGKRQFRTTLSVTHGLPADAEQRVLDAAGSHEDVAMYATGIDLTSSDPGKTVESTNNDKSDGRGDFQPSGSSLVA